MAKNARSTPTSIPVPDPLAESIDRLTAELHVFRETIDELREEFSWVTRNGLPVQPIEHVVVKRMALDPCAVDWNEKLQLDRREIPGQPSAPILDIDLLHRLGEGLTATVEAVAQGQLDAVLTALDVVRNQILTALDHKSNESHEPPAAEVPSIPTVQPPPEKTRPGCLF